MTRPSLFEPDLFNPWIAKAVALRDRFAEDAVARDQAGGQPLEQIWLLKGKRAAQRRDPEGIRLWPGAWRRSTSLASAAGHLPGTLSSEGGQLLGVAYRTIAVRGARVVLIDDLLGVRARTTAHWLQRRGYEIALLLYDFAAAETVAA